MARTLTTIGIEEMQPNEKRAEVPDGGCRGLYLVIQPKPSGTKTWAVRYRFRGAPRKLTLGPWLSMAERGDEPDGPPEIGAPLTLAQARSLAASELLKVALKKDPAAEKRAARRAEAPGRRRDLWEEVAADFVRLHCERNNKARTAAENARLLRSSVTPHWKGMRMGEITAEHVVDLLDGIAAGDPDQGKRPAPIAANRVRAVLMTLFGWAMSRRLVKESPVAGIKPNSEKGRSRKRAPDDADLRLIWRASGTLEEPFGNMVKMLVVTGARLREVAGMRLAEINFREQLWTLPAARAKNSQEHVIPLNSQAMVILAALGTRNAKLAKLGIDTSAGYLFTTIGTAPVSGFSKAKAQLDRRVATLAREAAIDQGEDPAGAVVAPWVMHDLRRTLVGGLVKLKVRESVAEAILGHKGIAKSGIAGTYNRASYTAEARAALAKWGTHVERLVSPVSAGQSVRRPT